MYHRIPFANDPDLFPPDLPPIQRRPYTSKHLIFTAPLLPSTSHRNYNITAQVRKEPLICPSTSLVLKKIHNQKHIRYIARSTPLNPTKLPPGRNKNNQCGMRQKMMIKTVKKQEVFQKQTRKEHPPSLACESPGHDDGKKCKKRNTVVGLMQIKTIDGWLNLFARTK